MSQAPVTPYFHPMILSGRKKDNRIYLNVSDNFRNTYVTVSSASALYALQQELANFETAVSMLSDVYESITGFTSLANGV